MNTTTLSESQGLQWLDSNVSNHFLSKDSAIVAEEKRRKQASTVYIPRPTGAHEYPRVRPQYQCVWCKNVVLGARHAETGAKHMFKCRGGCEKHYLCSRVCWAADWEDGHKNVCLAISSSFVNASK